jgi:hypothetical protein
MQEVIETVLQLLSLLLQLNATLPMQGNSFNTTVQVHRNAAQDIPHDCSKDNLVIKDSPEKLLLKWLR